MERLDFASVMAVLRRNIPDENFGNQADFLDSLFLDMGFSPQTAMEFDQGQVCRWINGLARLSPNIISFYQDNFNATASQDQFLDVMLKYRCRILFTTRSRYENHISLEVGELNPDTLLELVGKFFPEAERKQDEIKAIIDLLHGHTFAVELAARLLANGLLKPKELLTKLQKEKAALDAEDKIGTTKDGRNRKATYYDHIHSLFSMYKLAGGEQEIMRCMTLIPANGIPSRRFAAWMDQQNMNTINDLTEMGFIHPKNNREILLHPMIREVAMEELKPSVRNCSVLLDSLQENSLMHGLEFMNNKQVFHTVESIITTLRKDDTAKDLLFLENVFQYMDKYRYESGMQAIIEEMTTILSDDSVGTSADRACLLDARAVLEKNTKKQIELVEEAIRVLGEPQRAYSALLKLARTVKELNSDQSLDYGLIQQVMGSVCVVKGDAAQAQLHHQRAMAIFEVVFEDEPVLLEEKREEIGQAALVSRQKNQKLLV